MTLPELLRVSTKKRLLRCDWLLLIARAPLSSYHESHSSSIIFFLLCPPPSPDPVWFCSAARGLLRLGESSREMESLCEWNNEADRGVQGTVWGRLSTVAWGQGSGWCWWRIWESCRWGNKKNISKPQDRWLISLLRARQKKNRKRLICQFIFLFFCLVLSLSNLACRQSCVSQVATRPGRISAQEDFLPTQLEHLHIAQFKGQG